MADAVRWHCQDEILNSEFCPGSRVVPDTGLPLAFTGLPYIDNTENRLSTPLTFEHAPRGQAGERPQEIVLENSMCSCVIGGGGC